MKPPLFKALQFVVSSLGIGTLRLKQVSENAITETSPRNTLPPPPVPDQPFTPPANSFTERKLQTVDLLVVDQIGKQQEPEWDSTRAFSLQLARLARGAGLNEPPPIAQTEPEQKAVRTLAIGFPTAQQNRLRQDFAGTIQCELDFVTLDAVRECMQQAGEAALILINIASVAVTKRLAKQFLDLLDIGKPTLFTGSRAALKSLGVLTNRSTDGWDFLPVPWDRDELVWRLLRLTQQHQPLLAIAAPPPPPRRRPAAISRGARRPALSSGEPISQAC